MIIQRINKFQSTIIILVISIIGVILAGTMAPAMGMTGPAKEGKGEPATQAQELEAQAASSLESQDPSTQFSVTASLNNSNTVPIESSVVQPATVPDPDATPTPTPPGSEDEDEGEAPEEEGEEGNPNDDYQVEKEEGEVDADTPSSSPNSYAGNAMSSSINETLFGACNYLTYCRWASSVGTPTPSSSITNATNIPNTGAAIFGQILFALTGLAYFALGVILQIAVSIDVVSKGIFISDYVFAHLISGSLMSDQGDVADAALISSGQVVLGTILLVNLILYVILFGVSPLKGYQLGPFGAVMHVRRLIMSAIMTAVIFALILIMSAAAQRNHSEFDHDNPAPIASKVGAVEDMSAIGVGVSGAFQDDRINAINDPENWATLSPGWATAWASKIMYSVGGVFVGGINSLSQSITAIADRDSIGTCTYYVDGMHSVFRSTPAAQNLGGRGEILVTYDNMVRNLHFNNYRMAFGSSTTSSSNSWCRAAEAQAESPIADQLMIARVAGLYKEIIGTGNLGISGVNGSPEDSEGGELVDADGNWVNADAQITAGTIFGPYFQNEDSMHRSSIYFAVCQWTPGSNVSINKEWHGVQWYDTGDQSNAVGNLINRGVQPILDTAGLANRPEFNTANPNKACIDGIVSPGEGVETDPDGIRGWFTSDGYEGSGRFGYLDGLGKEDLKGQVIGNVTGGAFGYSNDQYEYAFVKDNGERAHEGLNYVNAINGLKGPTTLFLGVMSLIIAYLSIRYFGPLVISLVLGNMAFILALAVIWIAMIIAMFPINTLRSIAKGVFLTMVAGQIVTTFAAFIMAFVFLAAAIAQLLIAGFVPLGGNPWLRSAQFSVATIIGFWAVMYLIKNSGFLKDRGLSNIGSVAGGVAIGKSSFAPIVSSVDNMRNDKYGRNEGNREYKAPWDRDFWFGEKKDGQQSDDLRSDRGIGKKPKRGFLGIGGTQSALKKGKGGDDSASSLGTKNKPKRPKDPNSPQGKKGLPTGDKAQIRTNPRTGKKEYWDPKANKWRAADALRDKNGDKLTDKNGNAIPVRTHPGTKKREYLDPNTGQWVPVDEMGKRSRLTAAVRTNPETGEKEYLDPKTGQWKSAKDMFGKRAKQMRGQQKAGKDMKDLAPFAAKIPVIGTAGAGIMKAGGTALEATARKTGDFVEFGGRYGYEKRAKLLGNYSEEFQDKASKALEFGDLVQDTYKRADDASNFNASQILSTALDDPNSAKALGFAGGAIPPIKDAGAFHSALGKAPSHLLPPDAISGSNVNPASIVGNTGSRLDQKALDQVNGFASNAEYGALKIGTLADMNSVRPSASDSISRAGTISSLGMTNPNLTTFVNGSGDSVSINQLSEAIAKSGSLGHVGSNPESKYDPRSLASMQNWANGNVSGGGIQGQGASGSKYQSGFSFPDAEGEQQTFLPNSKRFVVGQGGNITVEDAGRPIMNQFTAEDIKAAKQHLGKIYSAAEKNGTASKVMSGIRNFGLDQDGNASSDLKGQARRATVSAMKDEQVRAAASSISKKAALAALKHFKK